MDDQREDHSNLKKTPQRAAPTNYRPLTCLPMMWKILMAHIKEIIYTLISWGSSPTNRKDAAKNQMYRGTNICIYQHIRNESKTRQKNLAMACIDYKKAYNMVPQTWIVHCLKMYKIPDQVIQFIKKNMETW